MSGFRASTFNAQEAASYDAVAESFRRLSERYTRPWATRLVTLARPRPRESVLDVGTGTGVVALEAARRMGQDGRVLGIDVSEGMLEAARIQAAREGLSGLAEFRRMDAEELDLDDSSFDLVLSLFALLHFRDPERALREIFRVLRPGGRLVLGVGSGAPRSLRAWRHGLQRARGQWQKWRGRRLSAPESLQALLDESRGEPGASWRGHDPGYRAADLPSFVKRAGFVETRSSWHGEESVIATAEEFWELQETFSSRARRRLASLSPEARAALRREFVERCQRVLSAGGELVYPHAVSLVSARRPG